jgi:hypothetical protein
VLVAVPSTPATAVGRARVPGDANGSPALGEGGGYQDDDEWFLSGDDPPDHD